MLDKLIFKIGGKTIELTEDEAQELRIDLNQHFEKISAPVPLAPFIPAGPMNPYSPPNLSPSDPWRQKPYISYEQQVTVDDAVGTNLRC